MKKFVLLVALILIVLIALTSCTQLHCATYSSHNKKTSYGNRAQAKYYRHAKRPVSPIFASKK